MFAHFYISVKQFWSSRISLYDFIILKNSHVISVLLEIYMTFFTHFDNVINEKDNRREFKTLSCGTPLMTSIVQKDKTLLILSIWVRKLRKITYPW